MKFSFDTPHNTAVITCCHVAEEGKSNLYVSNDAEDGIWQFLCGGNHRQEEARLASLAEMAVLDLTICELAKMPCGCVAERCGKESAWTMKKVTTYNRENRETPCRIWRGVF